MWDSSALRHILDIGRIIFSSFFVLLVVWQPDIAQFKLIFFIAFLSLDSEQNNKSSLDS